MKLQHGRSGLDPRNQPHHSLHIFDGQLIIGAFGFHRRVAARFIVGVNQVCAHALNLVHHILLAGQAHGDHQDQTTGSDDHAQSSQGKPHLAGPKRIDGQAHDLAEEHGLPGSFYQWSGHNSYCNGFVLVKIVT